MCCHGRRTSHEADNSRTPAAATDNATNPTANDGLPANKQHTHDRESETNHETKCRHRPLHRGREPPAPTPREGFCSSGSGPITRNFRFPRINRFLQRRARKSPFHDESRGHGHHLLLLRFNRASSRRRPEFTDRENQKSNAIRIGGSIVGRPLTGGLVPGHGLLRAR